MDSDSSLANCSSMSFRHTGSGAVLYSHPWSFMTDWTALSALPRPDWSLDKLKGQECSITDVISTRVVRSVLTDPRDLIYMYATVVQLSCSSILISDLYSFSLAPPVAQFRTVISKSQVAHRGVGRYKRRASLLIPRRTSSVYWISRKVIWTAVISHSTCTVDAQDPHLRSLATSGCLKSPCMC